MKNTHDETVAEDRTAVYECVNCGTKLYEGDTFVPMGWHAYCTDCAEDRTA